MQFKYFFIGSIIFLSCLAEAQIHIWPITLKARGERSEDQSLQLKSNQLPSFGISYTMDRYLFSLDFARYVNDSNNGNVEIETEYNDVNISVGYSLFTGDIWDFFAVATVGSYQQKVKTSINNLSTENKSNDRGLVGIGGEYLIQTPFYFSTAVGARLNWTQDLDPEIAPEMYLKLGASF